ncbi:MAG: radical SAM protein, partial [Chitinivibrionia bacterium]|nr:radical SAM protein [Chitinivibrionia bacterium]
MIKICNSYTNQFWAKTLTAISPAFTKKILSCITKLGFLLKYKTTANQARSDIETFFKRKPLFNYVEIETFNRCNGTCSFCPVNRNLDPRPLTKMSEKTFYKIIDNLSKLNFCGTISYYSNNEPIMDARIVEFIRYGVKKNPNANHSMISNGTLLNEEKFQALIDAGLNNLEISNYNDKLKLNENIKKIYDKYKNEKFSMNCKISLRLNNQILSNRGGTAPNKFPPPP